MERICFLFFNFESSGVLTEEEPHHNNILSTFCTALQWRDVLKWGRRNPGLHSGGNWPHGTLIFDCTSAPLNSQTFTVQVLCRTTEQLRFQGPPRARLVQAPAQSSLLEQMLRAVSAQVLSTSQDGDSTKSLSKLFQCLTTLTMKKFSYGKLEFPLCQFLQGLVVWVFFVCLFWYLVLCLVRVCCWKRQSHWLFWTKLFLVLQTPFVFATCN